MTKRQRKKKDRSHSKIAQLSPEVKKEIDDLLADAEVTYQDIVDYLKEKDISISRSAVGRYAKRLVEDRQAIQVAQENMRIITKEMENYPDLDIAEAINRVMGERLFSRLSALTDDDINTMETPELLSAINRLTRAITSKRSSDAAIKSAKENAFDEISNILFNLMAEEEPELYRQLVSFLERKRKEELIL